MNSRTTDPVDRRRTDRHTGYMTNQTKYPVIEQIPGRVILRGDLGHDVAWDQIKWGDAAPEDVEAFNEQFEILHGPGDLFLAAQDYYQGLTVMRVIRRRSDDALFGLQYWADISKHGETFIEPNYDEHPEIEYAYDAEYNVIGGTPYVFTPVEAFTITGYRHPEENQ